jgi:hypothetical protein
MTLTQAQTRYVERVNNCHPGHFNRVRASAAKELKLWAAKHGYDASVVWKDARDIAELERNSED